MKISVIGLGGYSVFMALDHFHQQGETVHAQKMHAEAGGKGYNQAVAAARLGAEVSFLQAAGEDINAEFCKKTLIDEGVKPFVCVKKGEETAYAVILTDSNGENKVTVYKGAELEESDVEDFEQEIINSDFLILQNEVPHSVNKKAAEIAYKHNVKIIYNPAPARKVDSDFLDKIYLATPNKSENDQEQITNFGKKVITLGGEGALIVENQKQTKLPVYGGKPVDTTGAGDTFTAALTVALASGKTLHQSAQYALIAAGLSVSKKYVLPSLPYKNEIEKIIRNS